FLEFGTRLGLVGRRGLAAVDEGVGGATDIASNRDLQAARIIARASSDRAAVRGHDGRSVGVRVATSGVGARAVSPFSYGLVDGAGRVVREPGGGGGVDVAAVGLHGADV